MSSDKKVSVSDGSSDIFEFDNISSDEQITSDDIDIKFVDIPEAEETEIGDIPVEEDSVMVEDLDDSVEIWDGGPTAGMVKTWKEEYGEVYVTSISYDQHIIWRVLNRMEYKQIVKKMEQLMDSGKLSSAEANMWNEEVVAKTCILYPTIENGDVSDLMAGVPSLIAQEVLEASGFVALEVRQL